MSDAGDKSIDYSWLRRRPPSPYLMTDDDDSDLDESSKRKEIIDPSKTPEARNLRPRRSSTKTGKRYGPTDDTKNIASGGDQRNVVKVFGKTRQMQEKVFPSSPQKYEGVVTRSQAKSSSEKNTKKEDKNPRVCTVNIKIKKHGKFKHSGIVEFHPDAQNVNDTTPNGEAPGRIRRHSTMQVKNKYQDYGDPDWTPKRNLHRNQKRHKISLRLRLATPETPSVSPSVNFGKPKFLLSVCQDQASTPAKRRRGRPIIPRRLWAHIESSVSSSDSESTVSAEISRPVIRRKYLKTARKDNNHSVQSFDSDLSSQTSDVYADILSQHTLQQDQRHDGSQQSKIEIIDLSESSSPRSVVYQHSEWDGGNQAESLSPKHGERANGSR